MLNTLTQTTRKKVMDMQIEREQLPVADIGDGAAKDLLTYLANLNLYSALNPGRVDQYKVISLSTMVVEGLMNVLHDYPELAHKILENMPATFMATMSSIGDEQKMDVQIVPTSYSFAIVDGLGDALDKETKDQIGLLFDEEPEQNTQNNGIDITPSFDI